MAISQTATIAPTIPAARRFFKRLLGWYMRTWHRLELVGMENAPAHGPALALCNHSSLLDVPALMVADPYADTTVVVKASLFKVPGVRQALQAWGAIPVDRDGRDTQGLRALLGALRAGRVVAVAAEGTRSRTGRLQPINPVLARLAVSAGVPVVPVGISGSYGALPPGAILPRRKPIVLRVGKPFTLAKGTSAAEAAQRIQDALAALLPPDAQPI